MKLRLGLQEDVYPTSFKAQGTLEKRVQKDYKGLMTGRRAEKSSSRHSETTGIMNSADALGLEGDCLAGSTLSDDLSASERF